MRRTTLALALALVACSPLPPAPPERPAPEARQPPPLVHFPGPRPVVQRPAELDRRIVKARRTAARWLLGEQLRRVGKALMHRLEQTAELPYAAMYLAIDREDPDERLLEALRPLVPVPLERASLARRASGRRVKTVDGRPAALLVLRFEGTGTPTRQVAAMGLYAGPDEGWFGRVELIDDRGLWRIARELPTSAR